MKLMVIVLLVNLTFEHSHSLQLSLVRFPTFKNMVDTAVNFYQKLGKRLFQSNTQPQKPSYKPVAYNHQKPPKLSIPSYNSIVTGNFKIGI